MASSGVPLNARTLAHSHQNDLQRITNPRLEVNERRLRPIYDYMEIHNYRKALTEIDRLLKKQSNFTACKALKCLVLLKLERHDEAHQLANELELLALSPTRIAPTGDASNVDENALTFFSQYYKDLRQFDKVVALYEAATKREPTSEELLCSLFMSYVRLKDYKNQVLTAQKLYKHTQKVPYYNWAVISVLLQIDDNSNQLKQTLYVPMALKMLEKEFFNENQTKTYGEMECLLYLYSLELKEDFSKALNFLNKHLDALTKSPSNESMLSAYFSHEKPLIYNYKAGNYLIAYQLAKQYLIDDNYLWNWYEILFDSFFQLDSIKQDEFIDDLHQFIFTTPEDINDLRNIHLARIELGYRWQQSIRSKSLPELALNYLSDRFFNEITSYIEIYCLKTTGLVMFDIYRMLEYFSSNDRKRLHEYLIKQITSDNIQYLINILYCARLCGNIHHQWLIENHLELIQRLFQLSKQSSIYSIELILLIVNIMNECKQSNIDLYNFLDRTYEKDSTNFDMKLYLYQFALNLNCSSLMKDYFERLEIKNIQYFSLSYLLTDQYLRIHRNYRYMKTFFNYLTNILLVYTDDSWSQIMFCYKYGNFLRIHEIRTFSDCYLTDSLIYIQSIVGSIIVDLIQNGIRYQSISQIFKSISNQILFEQKSPRSLFYRNDTFKVQDTRDFDIWSKIDHRRLCFDENTPTIEKFSYADRVLLDNSGQRSYQSPTYKDSYLRQYQNNDFQQRIDLCYFRTNILNLLQTLFIDRSTLKNESIINLPDEQMFERLKILLDDFNQLIISFKSLPTITPCELPTIMEFQFEKLIPLFIRILLDGLTINKSIEATANTSKISLINTTIHWEKIDQYLGEILRQIEQSYSVLIKTLENTSFQKHCQSINDETNDFLDDFSGTRSPLEFYSIYTEFISYAHCFYLAIKSILATLFNKTSLLVDNNDSSTNRTSNSKKSKKKISEQQSILTESDDEIKLWNQLEKIELTFNEQWSQIIDNIRKYELYLRSQVKLTNEEYERLEKDIDGTNEQSSNRTKGKSDENNNNQSLSTSVQNKSVDHDDNDQQSTFEFGKTRMRSSTMHTFALGYLETLIQIRVCLMNKQKTFRPRQTST